MNEHVNPEAVGETPTNTVDVRAIAFYLPQFHPTPENDEWWGKGFTEWRNVTRSVPLFEGHYQPHLPSDLGYYDLRLDEVRRTQARMAREAGLSGFCFYYYWFNGRRILEMPLDKYVEDETIDFPFCICWANENWSRLWDGGNREVLLVQEHTYESDMEFMRDIIPLLKDPRYIRVDGKPLLILYRHDLMKDAEKTVEGWRAACRAAGLPGIYLCCVQSFKQTDPHEFGFDAACEFPPHQYRSGVMTPEVTGLPSDFLGTIYNYEFVARQSLTKPAPPYTLFRGIFPGWDNSARKRQHALVFHKSSPEAYEYWLNGLADYTRKHLKGDERILFINAWNEWAEGAHLEPDRKYGRAYLEATQRALTQRTDADGAFDSLMAQIKTVNPGSLRRELQAYIEEAREGFNLQRDHASDLTIEKAMADWMAQQRSSAVFVSIDLTEMFGAEPKTDVKGFLEKLNAGPIGAEQSINPNRNNYVAGWMLCDGIDPNATDSFRFLLLRHEKTGQVFAAQIDGALSRNDVAKSFPEIAKNFAADCGFKALLSFARVPAGGPYVIGFALAGGTTTAVHWTGRKFMIES